MAIGLKAVNGYQKRPNETMQLIMGLSSVPPGTSGAKPGHLGVPKTTFGIPGQIAPNRDSPGKTGTVGQLDLNCRDCFRFLPLDAMHPRY